MEVVESSEFVRDAVARIVAAYRATDAGAEFRLSLSGGRTPAAIYAALAEEDLDWGRFVITFGDERCVPPEHADSNFRMASEALLDRVPIPADNVIRMKGELDPVEAASECEAALRERAGEGVFRHDFVLLGLGEDGHTASLFPGTQALDEGERWVVANEVPQMETTRITMTYPLINAAREVLFLVTGETKREIVKEIAGGGAAYPAAGVAPTDGRLTWLLG